MGQSYNSKVKLVSGAPAKVGNIMNILLILQKIKNLSILFYFKEFILTAAGSLVNEYHPYVLEIISAAISKQCYFYI